MIPRWWRPRETMRSFRHSLPWQGNMMNSRGRMNSSSIYSEFYCPAKSGRRTVMDFIDFMSLVCESVRLWHLNGFCHQPNYIFSTLLYIIQRKLFQSPNHGVLLHAVENPGLVFTPSPNHNSIVCSWLSSTAVHPTIWLTRKTIIVWNIGNYL